LEQERQKIEQLTAGWDDPTQVDWGHEEEVETTEAPQTTGPIFKCTALYSYTVANFSSRFLLIKRNKKKSLIRHKIRTN